MFAARREPSMSQSMCLQHAGKTNEVDVDQRDYDGHDDENLRGYGKTLKSCLSSSFLLHLSRSALCSDLYILSPRLPSHPFSCSLLLHLLVTKLVPHPPRSLDLLVLFLLLLLLQHIPTSFNPFPPPPTSISICSCVTICELFELPRRYDS